LERCRNFKPLPLFSRFIFLRDFFTERAPQEKVGNTLPKKHIDHLTVTALDPARCPLFPLERCRNFKPLPLFSRFIFLRDFFTERAPQEKVGNTLPKSTLTT
jgi:hypothetical protein